MLTAFPVEAEGVEIVCPETVSVVFLSAAALDPFQVAIALSVDVPDGPPT
jgi:hypothetical protein